MGSREPAVRGGEARRGRRLARAAVGCGARTGAGPESGRPHVQLGGVRRGRRGARVDTSRVSGAIGNSRRSSINVLWTIIFGLIVGIVAKLLMPGRDPGGFIVTVLLGIAGSFVGALVGRALGFYRDGQGAGWLMSILGAVVLLLIYRLVVGRRPAV